jgi:plastocyanin
MTLRLTRRSATALTVSLAFGILGAAACFSERASTEATSAATKCSTSSSTAGSTIVFIREFLFETPTVHVKAGQNVAWVNCEPTDIVHSTNSDAPGWGSGLIRPGAAFVRAFPTTGTFPYHCAVHPAMKATIIVE